MLDKRNRDVRSIRVASQGRWLYIRVWSIIVSDYVWRMKTLSYATIVNISTAFRETHYKHDARILPWSHSRVALYREYDRSVTNRWIRDSEQHSRATQTTPVLRRGRDRATYQQGLYIQYDLDRRDQDFVAYGTAYLRRWYSREHVHIYTKAYYTCTLRARSEYGCGKSLNWCLPRPIRQRPRRATQQSTNNPGTLSDYYSEWHII